MHELHEERRALGQLLPTLGNATQRIHSWVFESDANASASSIRNVYTRALNDSELYIGIFWNEYGEWTIDEFHRAGELGIPRHIYVKNVDTEKRDPHLQNFLDHQTDVRFGITPQWFSNTDELKDKVTSAIQQWLLDRHSEHQYVTNAIVARIADDIPELPRRLVGREGLIQHVNHLLDDNERILLRGFGGMGKTALAATIAADWIEDERGSVVWINAGHSEAAAIFEAIGRAFDAQQDVVNATGEKLIQTVRHILSEHKALLVLDDIWNGSALARVARAIPRRLPFLATSRQRFPLDEVIEIGQLSNSDALKLLNYHARGHYDDSGAKQLCDLLGNHAFALEIAGKTLKVYNIQPDALIKRIEEAPHDLHMPAGFGELGRKGIKSLLDASIDALNRELYNIFLAMGSMFEPTATPELVARAIDRPVNRVEKSLQELTIRGLVNERRQDEIIYYQLHDLAYSYARAMFLSKGLTHQAVIQACHDYVDAHVGDLSALDAEFGNILEAAEAALQIKQEDIVVDMMTALAVKGPYFAARGHSSRSLDLLRRTIEVAMDNEQIETAHYLESRLGNTYANFLGNLDLALQTYQSALELSRRMNNRQREAILLTVIGTVRARQGANDSANYHQLAESIAREEQDEIALAQVLINRGAEIMLSENPDYEKVCQLSEEAANLAHNNQLHHIYFVALLNRGAGEHELGRYKDALKTHEKAYDFARLQANYPWMADALYSIGEDYHKVDERDKAQTSFDHAIKLLYECGNEIKAEQLQAFMRKNNYQVPNR